jgi:hypothetical protein
MKSRAPMLSLPLARWSAVALLGAVSLWSAVSLLGTPPEAEHGPEPTLALAALAPVLSIPAPPAPEPDPATQERGAAAAPEPLFRSLPLQLEGSAKPLRLTSGSPEKNWILEVNGNGLVLGDFDGDGRTDLVTIDGSTLERVAAGEPGLPPRLALNAGGLRFRAAPESFAMAGGRWGTGGVAGDPDNDGDLDLVVLEWGPDRLFENLSGQGFREVTEKAGFQGKRWATSGAFLDYDRDGLLDLAVVNYLAFSTEEIPSKASGECRWKGHAVNCGPEGLTPVHDQLYRGLGNLAFEEVSQAAGYRPEAAGFGLGISSVDIDTDGDTDLYISNDSTANFLWENQGDGTFREVGMRLGVDRDMNGKEQAGMGIATGDWNNDGLYDLLVTNFSGENNAFYVGMRTKQGRLRFAERSFQTGLGGPSVLRLGWGTGFVDVDLDGDLDLYCLNGHVYPEADRAGTDTSYAQPADLYLNLGNRFERRDLAAEAPRVQRAGAHGDLDGDGRQEIVALELDGGVWIYTPATPATGGWLEVSLAGRRSNRLGLGARIELSAGGVTQVREMTTAGGYQAGLAPVVHFGLGAAAKIDKLVVRWPSGAVSEIAAPESNRRLHVEEPEPAAEPAAEPAPEGDR